jgi:hypothetical protein
MKRFVSAKNVECRNRKLKTEFQNACYIVLLIALSGCQSAATQIPVVTDPVPTSISETPTPVPPTATQVPTTSPAPIPTANFVLADILGMWTRSDSERGTLFLIFNDDGSYVASHGTPEGIVHSGALTLEGSIFTFVNGWDCSPLGETEGEYILRLTGGGKYLLFEPLHDECPDRPSAFKSLRWDRVVVTPTP